MPWRLDRKNIAVTCLDFGIRNGTLVWELARRLTEIKKDEIYSLSTF